MKGFTGMTRYTIEDMKVSVMAGSDIYKAVRDIFFKFYSKEIASDKITFNLNGIKVTFERSNKDN
jgi:hypothetical protein